MTIRQILRAYETTPIGTSHHDADGFRWTLIRRSSIWQWQYRDYGHGPVLVPLRWYTLARDAEPNEG